MHSAQANRRATALTMLLAMAGCEPTTSTPPSTVTAMAPSAPAAARASGTVGDASRMIAIARRGAAHCYQQGLRREPEQEGKAAFQISIVSSGAVSQVQMTPTGSLTEEVMTCIHDTLAALTFAPPEGGSATISGSFTFVNRALHPQAP